MVVLCTAQGEEHGLYKSIPNSVKEQANFKGSSKAKADKMREDDSRIVKAKYINHQNPFGRLRKPYMRWAGEPIRFFNLIAGNSYDLPMGFINEINNIRKIKRSQEDKEATSGSSEQIVDREIVHEIVPITF